MMRWTYTYDDGCETYELVIPNERLYTLAPAYGGHVYAEGKDHDDVEWFLDFAQVDPNGEIRSKRFVTTEVMDPDVALAWALKVGKV